jgi:hypothetical protein
MTEGSKGVLEENLNRRVRGRVHECKTCPHFVEERACLRLRGDKREIEQRQGLQRAKPIGPFVSAAR